MALRARALYDFRSENPGEISLREHEVLSLCSEQDIEGWLEGINSRGYHGLFQASYMQVIRALEPGPPADRGPGTPARYANVLPGDFQPLPAAPPAAFQPLLQPQASPGSFQPPGAGFPYGGGALQPSPQQLNGGYQARMGSDDDWDDEWDDSSTVPDEPGALGSGAYPDLDGWSAAGCGAAGRSCLSTRSDLSLGSRGVSAPPPHQASGVKTSATVLLQPQSLLHLPQVGWGGLRAGRGVRLREGWGQAVRGAGSLRPRVAGEPLPLPVHHRRPY